MDNGEPINRITGTEMEWGGMVAGIRSGTIGHQITDAELRPFIDSYLGKQDIPKVGTSPYYFLGNGSRFYQDVGDLREYATPEDDSFLGTVANEIVNDSIMSGISAEYTNATGRKLSFTKRVIADDYTSRGYHISYSADARAISISPSSLELFGVFAATRGILFGSGALLPDGSFAVAQKTLTVTTDFESSTTRNKPVVNLRKEPHADKNRFVRIHDTSADPNISPWATRVKLGAGSLVLKMIENGITIDPLRFEMPLAYVAQGVAQDTTLKNRYKTLGGGSVTALDVQEVLALTARKMAASNDIPLSDEELWTIDEWEHAITDLRKDPRTTANRIDWTMRRKILLNQHERHGFAWDSPALRHKDRQFSEVAVGGIATTLRESDKAWARYMPPQHLVKERMLKAPETTRANIRHLFINSLRGRTYHASVSWESVGYNGDKFSLPNPYQSRSPKVEQFLRRILNAPLES